MDLYTNEQLQEMQQKPGVYPISDSSLLTTKYKNRWEMSGKLMEQVSRDFFYRFNDHWSDDAPRYEKWEDENIPDKSYADKFGGPMFSCDIDIMIGPEDWRNHGTDTPLIGDFVQRKKLYLYNWSRDRYLDQPERCPELEYFMDMHDDYVPVLEHYVNECYSDQNDNVKFHLYKLMVIEYATPTADEENFIEHREHNTDRFGPDHCDETLGGLHLGENYAEFQAQHPKTGEWSNIPELTQDKMLWMFGEHAERSGWTPTYHRMIHNPDPWIEGNRYSIIFDLQARYKGED
jgi:hypothetical protein